MSVQEQLARISGGKLWLPLPGGGAVELTNDDIKAALGYAQHNLVPKKKLGVHLVLAKYTMDPISVDVLEEQLPWFVWCGWWDYCDPGQAVSKDQIRQVARALLKDYCETEQVRIAGESALAHSIPVDYRTWKRKFARPYWRVMTRILNLEADVVTALRAAITEPENA